MSSVSLFDSAPMPSLLDQLLVEQQSLPAVETFARRHLDREIAQGSRVYEELIPVGRELQAGQQLAFQVDLDACTGCKACVTACHSMNGLAIDETWRDVGLVLGQVDGRGEREGFQQTVTTACHHCEDPACLSGCPVKAYEKDPVTGIVRHLDDQCIGCQYCVLKCPYDVPKYSADLKIVRKCDMCTGRLAIGESPACVQGCPSGAISIEIVDQIGEGGTAELIPGLNGSLPSSAYTRPTTRYVSERHTTALRPANLDFVKPAHAHDPLAIMLVLLQMSVGTLAMGMLTSLFGVMSESAHSLGLALAAVTAVLGLGAATLHLGRPQYAFRAFLGWRTSWMSREILVVGAYVPAVALATLAAIVARDWIWVLQSLALVAGIAGTACSMMIYIDTHRPAWSATRTVPLFAGSLLGLGSLGTALVVLLGTWIAGEGSTSNAVLLLLIGLLILFVKVGAEGWQLARTVDPANVALARGIRLMRGPLRSRVHLRFALAMGGAAAACTALASTILGTAALASVLMLATLLMFVFGELVERHLYFTAEASPGMPGA
jgi:formate dehydrogenase iron-sulfur subunit